MLNKYGTKVWTAFSYLRTEFSGICRFERRNEAFEFYRRRGISCVVQTLSDSQKCCAPWISLLKCLPSERGDYIAADIGGILTRYISRSNVV